MSYPLLADAVNRTLGARHFTFEHLFIAREAEGVAMSTTGYVDFLAPAVASESVLSLPGVEGIDEPVRSLGFLIGDLIYVDLAPLDYEWVGVESYGISESPPGTLLWLFGAIDGQADDDGRRHHGRLDFAEAIATAPDRWREGIRRALERTRPDLLHAVGEFEAVVDADGLVAELSVTTPPYAGPDTELDQPETHTRLTLSRSPTRDVAAPASVDRMTAAELLRAVLGTDG